MQTDPRTRLAVANNADLHASVFEAHGIAYARLPHAFVARATPPPFYAHLVTLIPDHDATLDTVRRLTSQARTPLAIKDSFASLPLEKYGFSTLLEARWIWRAPTSGDMPAGWWRVETPEQLSAWETAWAARAPRPAARVFPDALLARGDFHILGRGDPAAPSAGCVVNLSKDCAGLSNVFSSAPQAERFAEATRAAANMAGPLPLVGYEHGNTLDHARDAGFLPLSTLRVMIASKTHP